MRTDFEDRLRPTAHGLRELDRHPMDWWEGPVERAPLLVLPPRPSM